MLFCFFPNVFVLVDDRFAFVLFVLMIALLLLCSVVNGFAFLIVFLILSSFFCVVSDYTKSAQVGTPVSLSLIHPDFELLDPPRNPQGGVTIYIWSYPPDFMCRHIYGYIDIWKCPPDSPMPLSKMQGWTHGETH